MTRWQRVRMFAAAESSSALIFCGANRHSARAGECSEGSIWPRSLEIVLLTDGELLEAAPILEATLALVLAHVSASPPLRLWLVTSGARSAQRECHQYPRYAGLLGISRSVRQEEPSAQLSYIDIDVGGAGWIVAVTSKEATMEPELALDGQQVQVPRL